MAALVLNMSKVMKVSLSKKVLKKLQMRLNLKYSFLILNPKLGIEPGRSIVGETGVTLYEVGTIKEIPGVNKYVSIDGGMSDHIRTALYDAKYQALLVNRNEDSDDTVTIAGKLCESEISLLKTLNYLHQSNVELSCYIINWCISLLYGIQLQPNAEAIRFLLERR